MSTLFRAIGLAVAMLLPLHVSRAQAQAQAPAPAPARVVKNAVLQLITGDDGKDDTDVFTVTITNADGKLLERVFDAKEEIKPGTTFNLWLNKVRAASPEQLKGSKILIPHQHEMGRALGGQGCQADGELRARSGGPLALGTVRARGKGGEHDGGRFSAR